MGGAVGGEVELADAGVTPVANGFVGGQLVGVEELAHEAGRSTVQAVDVAVAIGTALPGQPQVGIAFA